LPEEVSDHGRILDELGARPLSHDPAMLHDDHRRKAEARLVEQQEPRALDGA
jgi:hypothetical protein